MTEPIDDHHNPAIHDERLALPVEQGVLLWCMRLWVVAMKHGTDVDARIDEMLDTLGAAPAAPYIKDFMDALSQGCTRMIQVRCLCRKQLDADERALLDVLALAQALRPFEALLLLRGFVTQAGAVAALRAAEGVGHALAQAGHFLPEPEQEVRHVAMAQPAPPDRRGTLH